MYDTEIEFPLKTYIPTFGKFVLRDSSPVCILVDISVYSVHFEDENLFFRNEMATV